MSAPLKYKGYTGTVDYSPEDKVFFGKIDGIKATVTYEGNSPDSLEAAFKESVDDYLDLCEQEEIEPEKPYKGIFSVRVPQELHRDLAHYARKNNLNLNGAARVAFEHLLHRKPHQHKG